MTGEWHWSNFGTELTPTVRRTSSDRTWIASTNCVTHTCKAQARLKQGHEEASEEESRDEV